MMQIEVCYFAALRELIGSERETVAVDDGFTADGLLARLGERHPAVAGLLQRSRVAQTNAFLAGATALAAGEACDIIPPVSGG